MLRKLNHLAFAAAIGVAALMAGSEMATAFPVTSGPVAISDEAVPVRHMQNHNMNGGMYWQFGRDGNRCRNRYGNCRHYYQGYYYQTPWWTLPLTIGNTIANGNHSNAHVRWCLSHYRSYNPRTDMWLGNSGNHYRCNSPY